MQKNIMSMRQVFLSGAAMGLAIPALFYAQTASAQQAEKGLGEIVVTAQKREENLQNVPVSVTAIGAEAIANQRITEFSDLTRAASSIGTESGLREIYLFNGVQKIHLWLQASFIALSHLAYADRPATKSCRQSEIVGQISLQFVARRVIMHRPLHALSGLLTA